MSGSMIIISSCLAGKEYAAKAVEVGQEYGKEALEKTEKYAEKVYDAGKETAEKLLKDAKKKIDLWEVEKSPFFIQIKSDLLLLFLTVWSARFSFSFYYIIKRFSIPFSVWYSFSVTKQSNNTFPPEWGRLF